MAGRHSGGLSTADRFANFAHRRDAFEVRVGYPSKALQVHCLASTDSRLAQIDPQMAFANEVVAAMKNRLADGHAKASMRQGELS